MGKTVKLNKITVGPSAKILMYLGHEPTVLAYGGPERPTGFTSFSPKKRNWVKGSARRWAKATKKLIVKQWGRDCLLAVGLPEYEDWQAAWALDKEDRLRLQLMEAVFQRCQKNGLDLKEIAQKVEAQKVVEEPQPDPQPNPQPTETTLDLSWVAKNCRKLNRQFKKRYLDHVTQAEERKRAWLAPLMWEALYNEQHHRHSRNKKIAFYKRAKATACFDCDQQFAPAVMTYDHLRNKHFTLGHLRQTEWKISWRRLHQEIGKCDVVCRDCHDIREYLRGTYNFAWEELTPEVQARIQQMCYVEREILFRVATRESEKPHVFDAESIRQTKLHWFHLKRHLKEQQDLSCLSFWQRVGLVMEKARSLDKP